MSAPSKTRQKPLAVRMQGVWELESWEVLRNGELHAYPHGPKGEGRLVLSPEGEITAFFQREEWPKADQGVKPGWEDFMAFTGTWRAEYNQLIYKVTFASDPGWIGATRKRDVSFDGEVLVLESASEPNRRGEILVNRLRFRRQGGLTR